MAASANLTPAERTMRAQLGAHAQWARCDDRTARTAAARAGAFKKFELQVDPDGVLDPTERAKRAEHARKAHMTRMALASVKARRRRAQMAEVVEELAEQNPELRAEVAKRLVRFDDDRGGAQ